MPPLPSPTCFPNYDPPSGAVDRPRTAPGVPDVLVDAVGGRFWPRVYVDGDPNDPATCWLYARQPSRHGGQAPPLFTLRYDTIAVARVAWELTGHGSIAGAALTPACGNAACCRPRHMQRREYGRVTRLGRGVAEIAESNLAAIRERERFQPLPSGRRQRLTAEQREHEARAARDRRAKQKQHGAADPLARPPTAPAGSAGPAVPPSHSSPVTPFRAKPAEPSTDGDRLADRLSDRHPDRLSLATFDALTATPGVAVWRTPLDDTTHVFTPWGHYEHEHHHTAMLLALANAPASVRMAMRAA